MLYSSNECYFPDAKTTQQRALRMLLERQPSDQPKAVQEKSYCNKKGIKIADQSKNGNLAGTKSCFAGPGDLAVSVAWEGVGV